MYHRLDYSRFGPHSYSDYFLADKQLICDSASCSESNFFWLLCWMVRSKCKCLTVFELCLRNWIFRVVRSSILMFLTLVVQIYFAATLMMMRLDHSHLKWLTLCWHLR